VATEVTASQAVLEQPSEAVPSSGDVVMVLDEDSTPPPPVGKPQRCDDSGAGAHTSGGGDGFSSNHGDVGAFLSG
jgi:hypothetical protein